MEFLKRTLWGAEEIQKFSKKIVLLCIRSFLLFTVIVITFNWYGREVQTEMIITFGAFIGTELGMAAWIEVVKQRCDCNKHAEKGGETHESSSHSSTGSDITINTGSG